MYFGFYIAQKGEILRATQKYLASLNYSYLMMKIKLLNFNETLNKMMSQSHRKNYIIH